MKTSKDKKYKSYHDRYSPSLKAWLNAHKLEIRYGATFESVKVIKEDIYLCPLCVHNFYYFEQNNVWKNDEFTLDHFPPENVAGKNKMFVCKTCNSTAGIEADYSLKEYLQFDSFLQKKDNAELPTTASYDGIPGNYNIKIQWDKGRLVQSVPFNKYPYVSNWVKDVSKSEWKFNLKFSSPASSVIQKALLRAAYLFCFEKWGYEFVLSPNGEHIRNVLAGKEEHPLSNFGVFGDTSGLKEMSGVYFIDKPSELKSFMVFFDIEIKDPMYKQKVFVIIPGCEENAWENLKNFTPWLTKKEFDNRLIYLPKKHVHEGSYFGYSEIWEWLLTSPKIPNN